MTSQATQVQDAEMAKEAEGTTMVAVRLRNTLVARIDARLERARLGGGGIKPSKSAMIAFLIEKGLDATDARKK